MVLQELIPFVAWKKKDKHLQELLYQQLKHQTLAYGYHLTTHGEATVTKKEDRILGS